MIFRKDPAGLGFGIPVWLFRQGKVLDEFGGLLLYNETALVPPVFNSSAETVWKEVCKTSEMGCAGFLPV